MWGADTDDAAGNAADDAEGSDDDDMPDGELDPVKAPVPSRSPEPQNDTPPPKAPATPSSADEATDDDDAADNDADDDDERVEKPPVAAPPRGVGEPRRSLEPEAADEDAEPPTGLIVGGAIGGALVLVAGAGVGGYFLITSLQTAGATITVAPR
jgi:hypothetical protein